MRKNFWSVLILSVLATLLIYSQALSNEDTAQLTFSKTAVSKKDIQTYTVQKGDVFSSIIRKISGITEKDIPSYYRMTKELNPEIDSLNKLYTGQTIVLPGKSMTVPQEKVPTATTPTATPSTAQAAEANTPESTGSQSYQVKKGDSLIRIIQRELQIRFNTQSMLKIVKSMNPRIANVNKIYAGQLILLPNGQIVAKTPQAPIAPIKEVVIPEQKPTQPEKVVEAISQPETIVEVKTQPEKIPEIINQPEKIIKTKDPVVPAPEERKIQAVVQKIQPEKTAEGKDAVVLSPAARLAVIKQVITQMNGTMITSGNYYLPVSKTEQLTIDCSRIPVVEMDDRSTIFLDLADRSNNQLKKMISDRWSNYHLVKIDTKDDVIIILKKIFKNTKIYEIAKAQKPITLGALPPLEIIVDWVIAKKETKQSSSTIQGLRLVYEDTPLLPRSIVNYARHHSLSITEFSPEKGLVGKPEELYSLPPITVFPSSSAKDFSYALLSYLNIQAEKDTDIRVFNIAQDGFNLSIKADIVLMRGEKKIILFSRDLPQQFINILKKAGNEIIFISDADAPAKTMEKILSGLNFVFTTGYFSFSGVDKNQPPYTLGFNGTKIKTDKDIYVVNMDFNQELRGLIQETWSASIVRY